MTQKNDGVIVVVFIIALIAFGIGAGVGISMSLDTGSENTNNTTDVVHVENVTEEMTSNLDEVNDTVVYDSETDDVDYNENKTFTYANDTYTVNESN